MPAVNGTRSSVAYRLVASTKHQSPYRVLTVLWESKHTKIKYHNGSSEDDSWSSGIAGGSIILQHWVELEAHTIRPAFRQNVLLYQRHLRWPRVGKPDQERV